MTEKQNAGSDGRRITPTYNNPALCQILQNLSDLPFNESSASQVSSFHDAISIPVSKEYESQGRFTSSN